MRSNDTQGFRRAAVEVLTLEPPENDSRITSIAWPEALPAEAFHGPLGDWVRLIEPHTEADPAALLLQALAAVGNMIGRSAYFRAEADRHYSLLNVALVGKTAKGRKGTSEGYVRRLMEAIDQLWATRRIKSGLSSGEGLVFEVRDAAQGGKNPDPGEQDKRLFVIEPEFASVFAVADRNGSTLSSMIRRAWDSPALLSPMTKTARVESTDPHISIIAHITREELNRVMSDTAIANGFANRFLWVCTRRSKCLPDGGEQVEIGNIADQLRISVEYAQTAGEVVRDKAARAMWHSVYPRLSEGLPGMLGAATSRAESQVMRLALIFAVLDRTQVVGAEHLTAALAVWNYCFDSARWIFGEALGDPLADELLTALRSSSAGMTLTEIRDYFGRNRKATDIGRALNTLAEHGRAQLTTLPTDGRPSQLWRAL